MNESAGRYRLDGFTLIDRPVPSATTLAAARDGMDRILQGEYVGGRPPEPSPWNPGDDPRALVKIEMPQFADPGIARLVADHSIGQVVATATGADWLQVFWVQMLDKPVEDRDLPARVGWHQDWHYWREHWEAGSELLTVWVALSDVDEANGPVTYVAGSHRWGLIPGGDFFDQGEVHGRLELPRGAHWTETPALLPSGGLAIHDRLTLHGSGPNVGNVRRRSLAVHLRTEHSRPTRAGRAGLARHIDDLDVCPVIYGSCS
jgi:ectoine hydroxylase-related dioxygenase (phytanoyl-CoA dioxygenase family)